MNKSLFSRLSGGRTKQRGITLGETLLSMVIGGALVVGAYAFYTKANGDVRAQQTADGVNQIITGIKDRYGALGGFSGINNAGVIANTLVPKTFAVSGTTINSPYGSNSAVTVAPTDGGSTFTVTVTGLPTSACSVVVSRIDSATTGLGAGATAPAEGTLATAATATTIKAIGGALDVAKTMTQCADGGALVQVISKAQ
ncbi:type II secretory pathway pseudopilin PulG [Roseateles asaccharophilus]|uniref:type 4 pilus major pilin n=1 Tax=Roseateles asaccharophilus TaxID=582607 RepID=UPI003837DFB0